MPDNNSRVTWKSDKKAVRRFYGQFAFFVLFLCINSEKAVGQGKDISTGNQQWLQYYNKTKLGDKWVWLTDGGYRWKDGFQQSSQYIARTAIGYSINPKVRISTGFAHLGFHSSGEINRVEFRPYQELTVQNKFNKLGLKHRYRIEERFFYPVVNGEMQSTSSFNFRFRYGFTISIPLFKLSKENPDRIFLLNIGDEIFINAGKDIVYNVFDQNRVIISPTFKLSNHLSISLTWNSQFSSTTTPASYKYTNVMWLQVKHTLDFRKPKTTKE